MKKTMMLLLCLLIVVSLFATTGEYEKISVNKILL